MNLHLLEWKCIFDNISNVSLIGLPIFFTGVPTFSSVMDWTPVSFAEYALTKCNKEYLATVDKQER